jgi:endonuclease/exonuclease/phosphatase family metal-dependent hydrolase
MTFNVLSAPLKNPAGPWTARRAVAAGVIRRWQPDVVGLQEPTPAQVQDLLADLPEYAAATGPLSGPSHLPFLAGVAAALFGGLWLVLWRWRRGLPQRRLWRFARGLLLVFTLLPLTALVGSRLLASGAPDTGEMCAILYRQERFRLVDTGSFWLSETPDRPNSIMAGTWLPRVANWARLAFRAGGGRVIVYNTHFDYLNPWARARAGAVLRARMNRAWDGSPQVLTGDFNAPPGSSVYRVLLAPPGDRSPVPPLIDAWAAAAARQGPAYSFHGGVGRYRWPGRIDHILFRPRAPVPQAFTIPDREGSQFPSDHYPVLAVIMLPARR